MANTYTLIQSYTATGSVASIDFNSIPGTYTDLQVVISGRSGASFARRAISFTINGSTANDYRDMYLLGNGTAASSAQDTPPQPNILIWDVPAATSASNTFSNISVYIPNYSSSSITKCVSNDGISEDNSTAAIGVLAAGLYMQNTAITSLSFAVQGNFVTHSSAYLYGIKNS